MYYYPPQDQKGGNCLQWILGLVMFLAAIGLCIGTVAIFAANQNKIEANAQTIVETFVIVENWEKIPVDPQRKQEVDTADEQAVATVNWQNAQPTLQIRAGNGISQEDLQVAQNCNKLFYTLFGEAQGTNPVYIQSTNGRSFSDGRSIFVENGHPEREDIICHELGHHYLAPPAAIEWAEGIAESALWIAIEETGIPRNSRSYMTHEEVNNERARISEWTQDLSTQQYVAAAFAFKEVYDQDHEFYLKLAEVLRSRNGWMDRSQLWQIAREIEPNIDELWGDEIVMQLGRQGGRR